MYINSWKYGVHSASLLMWVISIAHNGVSLNTPGGPSEGRTRLEHIRKEGSIMDADTFDRNRGNPAGDR